MTPSERRRHLFDLADELDVTLVLDRTPVRVIGKCGQAESLTGTATVFGWTGDNVSYVLGLHEIGHFACNHTRSYAAMYQRYWSRILEAEAEAWAWALDHALEDIHARTLRRIRDVHLGSYVRDYGFDTAGVAYSAVASQIGLEVAA